MHDFGWIQQHEFLRSRQDAETIFNQLGFEFVQAASKDNNGRPQRPRLIGIERIHQTRLELIGPDEVIFKATLMVSSSDKKQEVMHDFLNAWIPIWSEGKAWLASNLAADGIQRPVETQFRELGISLRPGHKGVETILSVTWKGPEGPVEF